jgi:hypothetical protein
MNTIALEIVRRDLAVNQAKAEIVREQYYAIKKIFDNLHYQMNQLNQENRELAALGESIINGEKS